MALLDRVRGKVFSEDVTHVLGLKSNGKGIVGFVLGHGCYGYVGRVREIGFWAAVNRAEELGYFANTVRAIIEKEESVVVCRRLVVRGFKKRSKLGREHLALELLGHR